MRFFQKHRTICLSIAALCALIVARMVYMQSIRFGFLFWNLFLALIPLYCSHRVAQARKPLGTGIAAVVWLLFFPNAAYLLTDIIHLRHSTHLVYWLDMVILYLAGIYGLFISMYSLKEMETWYSRYLGFWKTHILTIAVLLLAGYGIYLGRVERWNSWDVIAQPMALVKAMADHSRHPFRNREVWLMSSVFGAGLVMLYYFFADVLSRRKA